MLASQLLCRVQLPDLQALKNCNRLLRSLVDAAPEAVLQAALLNTHNIAPYHPAVGSGDTRAYLAQQAATHAVFDSNTASWRHSYIDLCEVFQGFDPYYYSFDWARLSHDGCTLATLLPNSHCLQLAQRSGQTRSVQLPEGLHATRWPPPRFNHDDSALALLLRSPEHQEVTYYEPQVGPITVMAIIFDSMRVMCVSVEADGPCCTSSAFTAWAPTTNKLCVTLPGQYGPSLSVAWVFDEQLALIARISGQACDRFCRPQWNATGSGLIRRLDYPDCGAWHGCILPKHPDERPLSAGLVTEVGKIQWGPYIPGTGEVILVSRYRKPSHRGRDLTCWTLTEQSVGAVELGLLLSDPDATEWAASLRHVAVIHGYDGVLQLHLLQPWPHLELQHSLELGPYCHSCRFSGDACYLLLCSQDITGAWKGRTPAGRKLVVVHVRSGRDAEVMKLSADHYDARWMPRGICIKSSFTAGYSCILIAFPDAGSGTILSTV